MRNGSIIQKSASTYNYGEIPKNKTEEFSNANTVFEDILQKFGYEEKQTFFRRRKYLQCDVLSKKIYKDELVGFDIFTTYNVVVNPKVR